MAGGFYKDSVFARKIESRILDQGGKFPGNLGTRLPRNVKAQVNFWVGFTRCHKLMSLTEGCELTTNDFL